MIETAAPLRVLHLHSGNLYGGVETFLTTLAREALASPEMQSSFALCFEGRVASELRAHGHEPFPLGAVRLSRPQTVRRARRALAAHLAGGRFDLVVCHQAWPYVVFGPAVRRCGLPLVFWLHTAGDGGHWLERWARRVTPDLAVANSRFTAVLLSRWFPDAPVETVYYPLRLPRREAYADDLMSRREIRRELDTSLEDLVIVQVGRLERWKGNLESLEAAATLHDLAGWKFWVVGGPQRPSEQRYLQDLKATARRHGIDDRVQFLGERGDVAELMRGADIYCQPNVRAEAFGLTLVEAQGAGLAIVTSALGGAQEIVDDASGLLVAPGDITGIAGALRRLSNDEALRRRLGRAALARAGALCDVTRQMQTTARVLSGAAGRYRRPWPVRPDAAASPSA